jgi:hypothetical protein
MGHCTPVPVWLRRLGQRLANLTPGRYTAIIEIRKRGVVHDFTLTSGPAKVERLDKEDRPTDDE